MSFGSLSLVFGAMVNVAAALKVVPVEGSVTDAVMVKYGPGHRSVVQAELDASLNIRNHCAAR